MLSTALDLKYVDRLAAHALRKQSRVQVPSESEREREESAHLSLSPPRSLSLSLSLSLSRSLACSPLWSDADLNIRTGSERPGQLSRA